MRKLSQYEYIIRQKGGIFTDAKRREVESVHARMSTLLRKLEALITLDDVRKEVANQKGDRNG